jgi:hypothetical protein
MKHIKTLSVLVTAGCLTLATGCDQQPVPPEPVQAADQPRVQLKGDTSQPGEVKATIIEFEEVEAGVDPYLTRMTVSDRYIRIDDSAETDGFVLFDRLKKRIFSVVHSSQSILVVDPISPLAPTPENLEIRSELTKDEEAPTIGGIQPGYYQFYANDQLCYHLVAVEGFMPDVSRALQSYQAILAAQQQETLVTTPKELQTPCFLANYIYAPVEYSAKGFPIEQWDVTGYRRSLSGIEENVVVDPSLFDLPADYGYFSIGGDIF